MAWEVFRERVYDRISEPDTAVAVDDRVIVDIGAHIGSFSVLAAQQTRGRANIFAYEPSPHLYDLLQKNIAGLEKVKALHCAVAGENGQLMLYLNPLNPAQNSLVRKTAHGVSVPAISLETLFRKHQLDHIDLLKVDCEGGEYAIFTAGEAQLPRIHRIVMEVHDPAFFAVEGDYSITGLQALLRRHNFAVKYRALDDYSGLLYARNLQFNGDGNTESLS